MRYHYTTPVRTNYSSNGPYPAQLTIRPTRVFRLSTHTVKSVIPAKAGIQEVLALRDVGGSKTFLDSGSSPE